jgi:hypothetical protein
MRGVRLLVRIATAQRVLLLQAASGPVPQPVRRVLLTSAYMSVNVPPRSMAKLQWCAWQGATSAPLRRNNPRVPAGAPCVQRPHSPRTGTCPLHQQPSCAADDDGATAKVAPAMHVQGVAQSRLFHLTRHLHTPPGRHGSTLAGATLAASTCSLQVQPLLSPVPALQFGRRPRLARAPISPILRFHRRDAVVQDGRLNSRYSRLARRAAASGDAGVAGAHGWHRSSCNADRLPLSRRRGVRTADASAAMIPAAAARRHLRCCG